VPTGQLETANSRLYLTNLLGNQLLGRALGSALFSVVVFLPFLLHGIALAFTAALVYSLQGTFRSVRSGLDSASQAVHMEILEGMRWLVTHRLFLVTAIIASIENLLGTACFSILVLYALEDLKLTEATYGLLISTGAIGGLLGSLVTSSVIRKLGSGGAIFFAILTAGLSNAGTTIPNAFVVALMLGLHSFSNVIWGVVILSLRQALIPDQLLGRVNSVVRLVSWGVIPLGAGLGGFLGSTFGLATPFWVAGAVVIALGFVVLPYVNNSAVQLARSAAALQD
jgi:hypothetical protein